MPLHCSNGLRLATMDAAVDATVDATRVVAGNQRQLALEAAGGGLPGDHESSNRRTFGENPALKTTAKSHFADNQYVHAGADAYIGAAMGVSPDMASSPRVNVTRTALRVQSSPA